MKEERRARIVDHACASPPADKQRAVAHYEGLARGAELHRLEIEQDKLLGLLVAIHQRIIELRG